MLLFLLCMNNFPTKMCCAKVPSDCLLNCLFRCGQKKISKLCVTGFCARNSPVTKSQQRENVSISWRHHETNIKNSRLFLWMLVGHSSQVTCEMVKQEIWMYILHSRCQTTCMYYWVYKTSYGCCWRRQQCKCDIHVACVLSQDVNHRNWAIR